MTKKKNKKDEVKELEEMLEKEVKDKDCKEEINLLKKENEKLKKELKEKEEILKNTQLQYLQLKNDFDSFTRRVKENEQKMKQEIFEKTLLKFIPILEDFMKSYEHLPEEFKDHKWTEGLVLINKKLWKFLEDNKIEIIDTSGELNEEHHEVIWVNPVEDEEKKWKIIQEVTKWYIVNYGDNKKVLIPAKVIIWQ